MPAKLTTNDLSVAACFALCFAQALIGGPQSKAAHDFREGVKHLDVNGVPGADRRRMLANGLAELRDLGIVECERDGEGDLVPVKLHGERIDPANARLITSDLN